jgi:hypothetical protein
MNLVDSLLFLKQKGLPIVDFIEINEKSDLDRAESMGFPLVLKVLEGHKTDIGGVILNIKSKHELERAFIRLSLLGKGILAQKQVSGVEIIVGIKKDEVFGHVLMLGIGGIFVEVLRDVSFRLCPITKKDALEMVNELRARNMLFGARGYKKVDVQKLAELLVSISGIDFSYVNEMDINPIIIDGSRFFIVDARIV